MFTCTPAPAPSPGCLCHHPAFARLEARMGRGIGRRGLLGGAAGLAALLAARPGAARVPERPAGAVVFTNIRLFDGTGDALLPGRRVVVEGGLITAVGEDAGPPPPDARVIDGRGRTLMPGLIDAHAHIMMCALPLQELLTADIGTITLVAAAEAERMLLRGFTSIRDMAGPSFALKRAIDGGIVAGPRIWPSGAMISQTGGHGDFRLPHEVPAAPGAPLSRGELLQGGMVADGADAVLRRVREQLMQGASQVKLAGGGGVASSYDPLDVAQFTEAEFRAAVAAAENWNTYVAVHAYTPRAIQSAIRAGVRCVEHGHLMDEATALLMAEKGTWLCCQPFLDDEDANPQPEGSANRAKQLEMTAGTDTAYGLAIRHRIPTAWGTDTLFSPALSARQGKQLAKMTRWYRPAEVLRMATATNASLLALSGPRNPYPGRLGVVAPGALADLLLVSGDPLADIGLLAAPEAKLALVMKDGRIYKEALG